MSAEKNLRARLRRLLKRAEPDVIAGAMMVTRGTVLRWRRNGIPRARIEQLAVAFLADKQARPSKLASKARYEKRVYDKSTIWDASTSAEVKTPADALAVASLLMVRLKSFRFPKGATFQWVVRGESVHKRDEYVKGAYKPIELRTKRKDKFRTALTLVPEHAFGRLDVCARDLSQRLSNLEPFFKTQTISIVVRKSRIHDPRS